MADKYINATALLEHMPEVPYKGSVRRILMQAPAADVAPIRHGRWVKSEIPCEKFVCSECGGACWYYDYEGEVAKSRYCPNCGADMRQKEET